MYTFTKLAMKYDEMTSHLIGRDLKFDILIGSDWPEMGQVWDFLRSVSVHFGSPIQNVLKLILKVPNLSHLVPIWPNYEPDSETPVRNT